jgi:hypothetical protein
MRNAHLLNRMLALRTVRLSVHEATFEDHLHVLKFRDELPVQIPVIYFYQ